LILLIFKTNLKVLYAVFSLVSVAVAVAVAVTVTDNSTNNNYKILGWADTSAA
jgi:hypothetical protein